MKGMKKAAKEQARATREAAEAQAKQSRLQAEAAQQQQESMINRTRAVQAAKDITENQKTQEVEVDSTNDTDIQTDELGRRRAPREAFKISKRSGSINI